MPEPIDPAKLAAMASAGGLGSANNKFGEWCNWHPGERLAPNCLLCWPGCTWPNLASSLSLALATTGILAMCLASPCSAVCVLSIVHSAASADLCLPDPAAATCMPPRTAPPPCAHTGGAPQAGKGEVKAMAQGGDRVDAALGAVSIKPAGDAAALRRKFGVTD